MIDMLHVLAMVLAAFRLTELVTMDRITAPLRALVPWFVITCGRCVSVWMAAVALGVYWYAPWLNWVLAVAWLYLAQADYRQVNVDPHKPVSVESFVGGLVLENMSLKEQLVARNGR